ncbi:unnamed protein product [Caenorhabditis bovis]|uniref:TAZ-type domain-containing protein n=1 Tax=Caenorhabditis bovis TaxID=2654633 RepID=A0A8S1F2I8_9PELO|nr:unnamed protein product [Caenorhabditis bovis]
MIDNDDSASIIDSSQKELGMDPNGDKENMGKVERLPRMRRYMRAFFTTPSTSSGVLAATQDQIDRYWAHRRSPFFGVTWRFENVANHHAECPGPSSCQSSECEEMRRLLQHIQSCPSNRHQYCFLCFCSYRGFATHIEFCTRENCDNCEAIRFLRSRFVDARRN